MAETVRERIIRQWELNLKKMAPPTYGIQWARVTREPIEKMAKVLGPVIGIYDLEQSPLYLVGMIEQTMAVNFEFWLPHSVTQGYHSKSLNSVMGDIQLLLLSDHNTTEDITGASLTLSVRLGDVVMDIDGPQDKFVSCIMAAEIAYRHDSRDPRILR